MVVLLALFPAFGVRAAAPTIAPIPDYTVLVDHPALVLLTVNDADTPITSLSLTLTTSNPALVDTNKDVLVRWFADGGGSPDLPTSWYATIAPRFGLTGTATNTVTVSDGTSSASATFVLTVLPPPANAVRFANTNQILLPSSGVASQYPSTNVVTGMLGTVTNVIVTFSRFTHQNPNDLHMLLVSPSGQGMVIWSKVGGTSTHDSQHEVTNVTATLTDAAPHWSPLPPDYNIWTERFRPGDYAVSEPPANNFPAPAPAAPYVPTLASNAFHNAFNGLSPNGTWSLYIYDDQASWTGSIAGGWSLTVATTGLQPAISDITDQITMTNTPTPPIAFTISDPDTPVTSLTVSGSCSNPTLVPTNNIVFSGTGSNRTLTITPAPDQSGIATMSVTVSDGTNTVTDTFQLTVLSSPPATASFTNTTLINILDNSASSPYPSSINVAGMAGTVSTMTVTLNGFNQSWGSDVDVLLVGPNGQNCILMSDCGSGFVNNVSLTFSNGAPNAVPASGLTTGLYRPTNLTDTSPGGDAFPSPAPVGPYGAGLTNFYGTNPNGTWSLYVFDDGPGDVGNFAGGWSMTITTQNVAPSNTPPTITAVSNQVTVVNTATAAIPLTIADAQTAASNLVLTAVSSNGTLMPTNRIVFGGAGSSRTVTLAPSSNQLGTATITLVVSDGSLVASNSFTLTVNPAPLTVTANSLSRGYGLTNPILTGSVLGLQAGDNITASFSTTANTNSPLGNYPITFTLSDPGAKLGLYTVTTNNGTLTVTNALLSVTASNLNKVYGTTRLFAGNEYAVTGGTFFNGNAITNLTLASAGTNASAGVGGYPISITNAAGPGLTNYLISYVAGSLSVTAAPLTVTANSSNKTYGATRTFAGGEFAITSGALFNGNTLTNASISSVGAAGSAPVGSYAIIVTNALGLGASNYAISYLPGALSINAASLLVTASNTNKAYGTLLNPAAFTVAGLLNGDSVTNLTLASGGSASNASVGVYAINASAAQGVGLTNYAIGYSNGSFTVSAASLLVSAGSTNKVYGATVNPSGFTAAGLLNGDNVTNLTLTSAGSVSNAPLGVYPINASAAQGVGLTNYTIGYSNGALTINAANLLVSAGSTNKVYGTKLNPAAFTVAGLLNGDSVTNLTLTSGGSVSNAPVGAYAISVSTAQGVGLTNYTIGYSNGVLTVSAASLLVSAGSTNKVYGATVNPSGFIVAGLLNGDNVTNLTLTSAGSAGSAPTGVYAIVASAAQGIGLTNYAIGYSNGLLTVNAASLLIAALDTNKVYGTALNPNRFSVTGLFNGDSVTNLTLTSGGGASNAPLGVYAINASAAQGVGLTNYTIGYSNGTLTVNAASLLITAGSTNKIYGAILNPVGFAVAGLAPGDSITNLTLTSAGSAGSAPTGVYAIAASAAQGVGLTNYAVGYSNGSLTVSAASLLIAAGDTNKVYGTALSPTGFSVAGLLNGDSVTNVSLASSGSASGAPVGGYSIEPGAALGIGLTNYTIGYSNGTLTVSAASLLITAGNTNKVYGATIIPAIYSVSGLQNADGVTSLILTCSGSASNATIGEYSIIPSAAQGVGLTNYTVNYGNGILTVVASALTVTPDNTNKVYGATHSFAGTEFTITSGALFNGDTLTNVLLSSLGAPGAATVGDYPIVAHSASGVGLSNYNVAYQPGTLSVGRADLLIAAASTNKVYGATLNPAEYSVAGLLNGDSVSNLTLNSLGSVSNAAVGSYQIVASAANGPGLTNYVIGYSNGTLTVAPALLTVTAVDKNRNFGQPNPVFTMQFDGFVNGEGTNVLGDLPVASTTATNLTPPGSYPIVLVGGTGGNYTFNLVAGTLLIVAPGNVTIASLERLDADHVRLAGTGDPGVIYKVQKSAGLDVWETLGSATPDVSGAFEFTDETAGAAEMRFYRLVFP
ncbi:MAG: hypothetical protein RLY20_789 [Verrucomicrobiota bacterium]